MTSCLPTNWRSAWCASISGGSPAARIAGDGHLADKLIAALPYQLTGAQRIGAGRISADLKSEHRMLRLLQGDVGSGRRWWRCSPC